jgi:hypothetical protein
MKLTGDEKGGRRASVGSCRAALWDGTVYLYQGRSECVAIVDLSSATMRRRS